MFKKFGVLAMVLAGAMFAAPVQAGAAEWHRDARPVYAREHRVEPIRRVYREPRPELRRAPYRAAYGYGPGCR